MMRPYASETPMSDTAVQIGLFDRAIRRIATVWRDMASTVAVNEDDGIAGQMQACLDARGGEVSARNRAAKLAQTYLGLDDDGRRALPPRTSPASTATPRKPTAPTRPSAPPRPPRPAPAPPSPSAAPSSPPASASSPSSPPSPTA